MEQYSRRDLIRLIDEWTVSNKSHWKGFAKHLGINLNSLNAFKGQYNGSASKAIGDIIADEFRGKFISTANIPVQPTYQVSSENVDKIKKSRTKKDKRAQELRRAIEDIQAEKEMKLLFELH